jgi:hypothetical protein
MRADTLCYEMILDIFFIFVTPNKEPAYNLYLIYVKKILPRKGQDKSSIA